MNYSVEEAAAYLNLNPNSVIEYIRRGRLGGKKIDGNWITTIADMQRYKSSKKLSHRPGRKPGITITAGAKKSRHHVDTAKEMGSVSKLISVALERMESIGELIYKQHYNIIYNLTIAGSAIEEVEKLITNNQIGKQ